MHNSNFLVNLTTLLLAAGIGTFVARKIGQPKILGQIIGGMIVGPSMLGIVHHTEFISNLAEIGVIILMFLAGLETEFEELKKSFDKSSWIAVGGIVLPFVFGVGSIILFKDDWKLSEAVFTGVLLTATSMGIAISTLSELGKLKSCFGMSVLGATIIDDVAGVIILAVTLGVFGKSSTSILALVLKIVMFFILVVWIAKFASKYINKNIKYLEKVKKGHLLAGSIFVVLLFGIFSTEFGMAAIIGAYFLGLIFSTTKLKHKITSEVERFGTSFFIPLFFVNIGLTIDISSIGSYFAIASVITLAGISSKIIGSGLGGKISGFSNKASLQVGISMIPRAEVTLIIANLGLKAGMIGDDVFTGAILLVLVSSILTPVLLKLVDKLKVEKKIPARAIAGKSI